MADGYLTYKVVDARGSTVSWIQHAPKERERDEVEEVNRKRLDEAHRQRGVWLRSNLIGDDLQIVPCDGMGKPLKRRISA